MTRDAVSRNTFEIGSLVQGKYQIIEVIGKGGMGVVYKARQVAVNKLMAVKRLLASREDIINEAALRRFQIEAKACFKLDHKNIVKVFDFDPNNGDPFLVMEFVEGISLSALIRSKVRLSIEETIEIALQLCDGLAHAHGQNILHRDLKPQNIMYQEAKSTELFGNNEPPLVKILDFGLAKIFDTADGTARTLTKTGEAFGTPLYMSPEQCQGKQLDEKSDVYSLGCVIYECLTGHPPFVLDQPLATMVAHINDVPLSLTQASQSVDFPPGLETFVARMLEKEPGNRHKNMSEVKQDLINMQQGKPLIPATQAAEDRSGKAQTLTLDRIETKKISMGSISFIILLLAIAIVPASVVWISDYLSHGTQSAQNTNPSSPQKSVRLEGIMSEAQNAMSAKDYKKAGDLYERAYVLAQEEKSDPKTLTELTVKLACALVRQGKITEAEPLFGQLTNELKIPNSPLGRSPDAQVDMDDLADAYRAQAQGQQAIGCLDHARVILEGVENLSHEPTTELVAVLDDEAHLLERMQKTKEAEKIIQELIDAEKLRNNENSLKTATSLIALARDFEKDHQYKKAEEASSKAYTMLKTHFPNEQSTDVTLQSEISDAAWLTAEIHAFEKQKSSLDEANVAFEFDKAASFFKDEKPEIQWRKRVTFIRDFGRLAYICAALGDDSRADSFFRKAMAAAPKGIVTVDEKIVLSMAVSQYADFLRKHNRSPEAQKIETWFANL